MFTVDRQTVCDETSLSDIGRGVNITLPRHQRHMTVQQICKLGLGQFAALWTVRHLCALVTLKASRSCCHLHMGEQIQSTMPQGFHAAAMLLWLSHIGHKPSVNRQSAMSIHADL